MIVVFGSINIDLVTRVERIAQPGETVIGPSYTAIPGGKGANQALAARRAGAKVTMAGAMGRDGFASLALSHLKADGVDVSAIVALEEPTGAAFIAVDAKGQNAITVAAGANDLARAAQTGALALTRGDLLLLQREVPDLEGEAAARMAKNSGARVILNLAPGGAISRAYLALIDILVMNEHEAEIMAVALGLHGVPHDALARAVAKLGPAGIIITLGAAGAVGWYEQRSYSLPAFKVDVVDTTAAGDAFVGAFAAALDSGAVFDDALQHGLAAGSLTCTKAGAQPSLPWQREITALIGRDR